MSEEPKRSPEDETQREASIPSPLPKRILAWVGVVYMVIIVLLTTYPFFHAGNYLTGIGPLFVCPGAGGLAAVFFWQSRRPGSTAGKKAGMIVLGVACIVIVLIGLMDGIPALVTGLRGGA